MNKISILKPRIEFGVFSFVLIITLWVLPSKVVAQEWEPFIELNALAYSENYTIDAILDDAEGSVLEPDGDATFTINEASIGLRYNRWAISVIGRYDLFADYTPDAAAIVFASEADTDIDNGDYDVDVRIRHSASYGGRLSYTHPISKKLDITGRLSGLITKEIIDGEIFGNLTFTDTDIDEGLLDVNYRFTQDLIFDRDIEKATGYGLSFDALAEWRPRDNLTLNVAAYDLFNRIWYNDLTGTEADATTAVSRTDDNGVLIVRPILSGRNLSGEYVQELPQRYSANIAYDISNRWTLSQSIYRHYKTTLTETAIQFNLGESASIKTGYEWASGAVGLDLAWHGLSIGVASDNLQLDQARYLRANIRASYTF